MCTFKIWKKFGKSEWQPCNMKTLIVKASKNAKVCGH